MKYYSEVTTKYYDSPEDCLAAEKAAKEAKAKEEERKAKELAEKKEKQEKALAERKEAAAALEAARKEMVAAQKKYAQLMDDFLKRFHSYHYTTTSLDDIPTLFSSLFNLFD